MQQNRRARKGLQIMIMVVIYLACAHPTSSVWALPEVDFRPDVVTRIEIGAGNPDFPQRILQINFTCPRAGRVHVIATGSLTATPEFDIAGQTVTLSITRNRITHDPTRPHTYSTTGALPPRLLTDFALQRVDACDAGQLNQYRLLAHATPNPAGPSFPVLTDGVLTVTFIAFGTPSAGAGTAGAPDDIGVDERE